MFKVPAGKNVNLVQGRKGNVSAILKTCFSNNFFRYVGVC